MSDPQSPPTLDNIAEEAGPGSNSAAASQSPAKVDNAHHPEGTTHQHHEKHDHPPPASPKPEFSRKRAGSSVSRVDIDFFDPEGVQSLRRTMTQQHGELENTDDAKEERRSSKSTDATLNMDNIDNEQFDFERTLRRFIRKRDEAQIKARSLGIAFRDVRVVGLGVSDSHLPTLGSLFNPFVIAEKIQKSRHPTLRNILAGFEGTVKPGEMLLVLGSPGSGCSTLLKTLANHRKDYHSVTGDVHYDSLSSDDIQNHFRGDVQYCPEDDVHFPTLTVNQTIRFAATCRAPRVRLGHSRDEYADNVTAMLETVFGLRHAQNTPVGDAAVRGVSGGEKKRVSIAEALAARSCINAWDNSTRGLDASTALEFVRALRIATDVFDSTTIVSLYQAGESLYQYFDKVCIIYEGRMAYFGPADRAKQYFLDMGYEPANRQTTPDFLVAVTDPNARIPRAGFSNQPRTAEEFAQYFLKSENGRQNREKVEEYLAKHVGVPEKKAAYIESAQAEFAKRSAKSGPYTLSIYQQIRAVMVRRAQIIRGNMLATGLNLFSFIFQGLIMGSIFLNSPQTTAAFFSRGGILFFSLLFSALTAMAEIPSLFAQRPIVLRHQKAALYHPFVEAVALTLVDIPITLVSMTVFSIIIYFMVGLQRSVDQYFAFLLFLFISCLTMKSFFRSIAASFSSQATAQTFGGLSVLALVIYTGFTIPKPSMIGALRWITYINPMKYGFEAIVSNEFRTLKGKCSSLVPQGPGYENISLENQVCTAVGSVPGQAFVDGNRFIGLSYGFAWAHAWMNLGIIIAFGLFFFAVLLLFSEFNTSLAMDTAVTLFKRNSSRKAPKVEAYDEEKGDVALTEKAPESPRPHNEPTVSPMTDVFSWQHINYTVPIPGKPDRQLLADVSGYVAPRRLTALMGESGAGKTTLLNVLAERTSTGVVSGDRFVNGQPLPRDFQAQTGYCQQMDTHVPFSTVREALLFSAKLRQPSSVPVAEKEAYVEKCLEMCGLEAYADASVGSLSVEHRKRTTIAVELAAKPKLLLFLDEPTSGLDSQSAWAIMSFLRTLADNGQAILCTIHQPSAELFQVFDRLLLLKKGGQTVYFGDVGRNATKIIDYFERNGGRHCLPEENPAEYMLDVIGAGATATSAQNWYDIWQGSPESKQVQQEVEAIHAEGRSRPAVGTAIHAEFATGWFYQVKELFMRDAEAHWRDPTYLMAKLALNAIAGLFIGFTFFKSPDTQQGTQNKLFAIFMSTILCVPLSNQLQVAFIDMRNIYEIRERPSRMYSWTALATSQILIELPWNIFGSTILFFTWYWTVGFPSSRAGFTYLMMGVTMPLYYTTFAQAVASMAPTPEIAGLLFSLLFSFVISFNGVLQPFRQLGWWKWMYHLSPFTYLIEALLGQAIGHQEVNCSAVEFVTINPPSGQTCGQFMNPYISFAGGYMTNPEASSNCNFCSVRTTDQFLANGINIFYEHHWRNFGILIAFVGFNISLLFMAMYFFRIRTGPLIYFRKKKN